MSDNKKSKRNLPKRDITSYVTKQMLSGNISILKIDRSEIERALERYCNENPSIDPTSMPLVGLSDRDGKDKMAKCAISLLKKYCGNRGSKTAVFSKDGHSAIVFGRSAKEIISKISIPEDVEVEHLKTKMKVRCDFPYEKKLKCLNGEKVSDHIR
jgi:hypothetical protein